MASLLVGLPTIAHTQAPTISGVNAFWYLGQLPSLVFSDGGTCSGHSGPCYFTQSQLTATPSSGSGYSWSVSTTGSGAVTLDCQINCSNVITVTATHASSGCAADVFIYATFGGVQSSGYGLTIVTPSSTTLVSGPVDSAPNGAGSFQTEYTWSLQDSCGNNDQGIDQTESFGSWTDDYFASHGVHNTWTQPRPFGAYATTVLADFMSFGGGSNFTPTVFSPQTPPCTVAVMHAPWTLYAGNTQPTSCSGGPCGAPVHSDTFQYYSDCGRHQ
jgi:hypothetical protein